MTPKQKSFDPQAIAKTSISVVEAAVLQMGNLTFSQQPEFVERKIIEYNSRMRVFGMEIFNGPCYISVVNYYLSQKHLENHDSCGAFVLYLEEDNAGKFLKSLGQKGLNENDPTVMQDACGEFCNTLAGNFKNELSKFGYSNLISSAPQNYYNTIPEGVEFHFSEYVKYETSFHFWKQKIMAVDVTIN